VRNIKIMSKARFAKTERNEDVGTARIVRKTKAAVAAGREIVLPKTVVDRLTSGEDLARVLREWPRKKRP
jgi:hypothetical protein